MPRKLRLEKEFLTFGVRRDEDFEVKSSQIPLSGDGLYSKVSIPRNVFFMEIDCEDCDKGAPDAVHLLGEIYIRLNESSIAQKINDPSGVYKVTSSKVNCKLVRTNDITYLMSLKRIRPGAELLFKYGNQYWSKWTGENNREEHKLYSEYLEEKAREADVIVLD